MSRKPTPQQQQAIDAILTPSIRGLKLEACAGSGKTSTLEMMATALVEPSLYLCFNKSNANEAKQRFPSYVDCRTAHSAAYIWGPGKIIGHKLERPKGRYVNVAGTGSEIAKFMGIRDYPINEQITLSDAFLGSLVKLTVTRFEQSADSVLSFEHTPYAPLAEKITDPVVITRVRKLLVSYAERLWAERINPGSSVLATPDTFLKMYQLTKPVFGGVKVLYVDEYQDTTPCLHDIVENQRPHMKVVVVGDKRQAIYGWRGAINAMEAVQCETVYLTQSFRYGPAVADVATAVLEGDMVIQGFDKINSKAGFFDMVDITKPYTRLYRTNAALLVDAIAAIQSGKKVAIEIDSKDFVKVLESAVALFNENLRGVKHDKIVPFRKWKELTSEAKHDPELSRIAKAVKEGKAEQWIEVLQNFRNAEDPDVTFTTAHKSKGREWKQVIVENDFKTGFDESGEWTGLTTEEQNLLVVACTRAQEVLQYNTVTNEYIQRYEPLNDSGATHEDDLEDAFYNYKATVLHTLKHDVYSAIAAA